VLGGFARDVGKRQGNGTPGEARRGYRGGSVGSNQGSHELSAVQGHSFSLRNANCGSRLVRALSRLTIRFQKSIIYYFITHKTTKVMIDICRIEIRQAIGKHLLDDSVFFVIRRIQRSMLQQYFRFGLNRKMHVVKGFVLLTTGGVRERHHYEA
jgi:hypothetical protein